MILSQGVSSIAMGGINSLPNLFLPENDTTYFSIFAGGTPGAANFTPFAKNGVLYQVTSGKTFKARGIIWGSAGANSWMQLVSATATFNDAAGSLTGGVYQCGVTAKYCLPMITAYQLYSGNISYDFAATTWPGFQYNSGATIAFCWLIGKEV